jgi:nucleotide-binding universal stress UspA family protein
MPSHVLVPFDGSPQAEAALTFATEEWPDASFTLLYVIDPVTGFGYGSVPVSSEEWYEEARASAEEEFEAAERLVDCPLDTRIEVGSPARAIVDVAGEADVDHVVVGSHGREGVTRILLGSVAETVVRRSPVPVTVVR